MGKTFHYYILCTWRLNLTHIPFRVSRVLGGEVEGDFNYTPSIIKHGTSKIIDTSETYQCLTYFSTTKFCPMMLIFLTFSLAISSQRREWPHKVFLWSNFFDRYYAERWDHERNSFDYPMQSNYNLSHC